MNGRISETNPTAVTEREMTLVHWALGRLSSDELPCIATEWLVAGLDSPALRELAGIVLPEVSEVGPLFDKALIELGMVLPIKQEALMDLARYHCQRIVAKVVSPYEGARAMWREVSYHVDCPNPMFPLFVGAASELEDLPERTFEDGSDRREYARELEETIMASAKAILAENNSK
jgi:hypothetical protein